jgi:hypothetical protein
MELMTAAGTFNRMPSGSSGKPKDCLALRAFAITMGFDFFQSLYCQRSFSFYRVPKLQKSLVFHASSANIPGECSENHPDQNDPDQQTDDIGLNKSINNH